MDYGDICLSCLHIKRIKAQDHTMWSFDMTDHSTEQAGCDV